MKVEIKQRPAESEGQPCSLCDEGCTFYKKFSHQHGVQCDEVTICKLGAGVSTMVSEGMKPNHCCPGAGFYELTPESRAEVYVRVKAEEWERVQGENANLKAGNKKLGEDLHTASVIEAEQEEELDRLSAENTYLKEANFDRLVPPLNDALQKLEAENAKLNTELADYSPSTSASIFSRGSFEPEPDQGEGWPEVSKAELMDYGESDGEYISCGYMIQARGSRLDQRQAQAMADYLNSRGKWEALRSAAFTVQICEKAHGRAPYPGLAYALAALKGDKS